MRNKNASIFLTVLALCLSLTACGKRTTVNLSELETRPTETTEAATVPETTAPETTVPETTVTESTTPETTIAETTTPETTALATEATAQVPQGRDYILNTNSKKIHEPNCSSVQKMKPSNKKPYTGTLEELQAQGYVPCKVCKPR